MPEDKSSRRARDFIALLGIALAIVLPRAPVLSSDFPLIDGGLFYAMAQDIQVAKFSLPYWTSYNQAALPFAYPPLALYLAALIDRLGRWSLLDLLRWLPFLFNLLAIPATYRLARIILGPGSEATHAVIVFALLPEGFRWYLMGGGLTRAPGFLFAAMALTELALVYRHPSTRHLIFSALFAGLTVLSHPQMTWFLAVSAIIFFVALGRSRTAIRNSLLATGGAVIISAPWWIIVLTRHGPDVFLAATDHGWPVYTGLLRLLLTVSTGEPFLPILLMMALLGAVVSRRTEHGWIAAWWVALFALDTWLPEIVATVPLALLAGIGLTRGLDSVFCLMRPIPDDPLKPSPWRSRTWRWSQIAILTYALLAALYFGTLVLEPLSAGEQQAMAWVAQNIPPDSKFLVLSGDRWGDDRSGEWFPALTGRTSIATVQGSEWLGDCQFDRRRRSADELRKCVSEDAACVESWMSEMAVQVTHLYVAKRQPIRVSNHGSADPPELDDCCFSLRTSLEQDFRYDIVYDGPDVSIYERRQTE